VLRKGTFPLKPHCWSTSGPSRDYSDRRRKRKGGRGRRRSACSRSSLSLQGTLPSIEDMACAASPREKLRSGFLGRSHSSVSARGRRALGDAVSCYGKGIEADDWPRSCIAGSWSVTSGRTGAEALSVFRRCQKMLSSSSVWISTETRAIADSLGRSRDDFLPHAPDRASHYLSISQVSHVILLHRFSSESVGNP